MEVPCVLTPASAARTYWLNMDRPSGRPWNNQRIPLGVAKSFLSQISQWASNAIVPFLVRAWPAICQVVGSSPSPTPSHCHFLFPFSFSLFLSFSVTLTWAKVCQVWSMSKIWAFASPFTLATPSPSDTFEPGIHFGWISGSNRYKSSKRKYCSLLRQYNRKKLLHNTDPQKLLSDGTKKFLGVSAVKI